MKKIIFFTCLIAFAITGIFAQSSSAEIPGKTTLTPEARAKAETDQLNSTVQLSPDQYAKILKINNDFFAKKPAPAANGGPSAAKLGTDRDNQIKAILTANQLQKVQHAMEASPKSN